MKKITIEELNEGYIIVDESETKKYAVLQLGLVNKIKELFNIPDQDEPEITLTLPPDLKLHMPEQELSQAEPPKDQNKFVFSEIPAFEYAKYPQKSVGKSQYRLVGDGRIQISRAGAYNGVFIYTTLQELKYMYDHPKAIKAYGKATYPNKAIILRRFIYDVPYSTLTASAPIQPLQVGDEEGTCDDITFESCANNSPEKCKFCTNQSRFEDKKKIIANKPAPPLMKAEINP